MTIPQILSGVGWPMFSLAVAFCALHTFNLIVPGVDWYIPSSEIGVVGYLIAAPFIVVGFILGAIGSFGERIQERWLERQHDE